MKFSALLLVPLSIAGAANSMTKTVIATDKAPSAIGPYSQAIKTSNSDGSYCMVFAAGQIGLTSGDDGDIVDGGVKNETVQLMENIANILEEAGSTFDDVVECTVLMADLANEYGKSSCATT